MTNKEVLQYLEDWELAVLILQHDDEFFYAPDGMMFDRNEYEYEVAVDYIVDWLNMEACDERRTGLS